MKRLFLVTAVQGEWKDVSVGDVLALDKPKDTTTLEKVNVRTGAEAAASLRYLCTKEEWLASKEKQEDVRQESLKARYDSETGLGMGEGY